MPFGSSSTISARARDVRFQLPQGLVGLPVERNFLDRIDTVVNKTPQAKQTSTITVNTATASHEYVTTIAGVTFSYTPTGSPTTSTVAAGIAAAADDAAIEGEGIDISVASNVITLRGRNSGLTFTVSSTDDGTKTTVATPTSAAAADAVPFGRAVIGTGYGTSEAGLVGGLAKSSVMTAQVETIAVVYASGEEYTVDLTIEGETYKVGPVDGTTDDATTAQAIVDAINARMPSNTVAATRSSANVVLTAEVAGKAFDVAVGTKTGTAARTVLTHTTPRSPSTDFLMAFLGVSIHAYDEEVTTVGGTSVSYPANAGVKVFGKGLIWVGNSESPDYGDPVYVELGSSNSGAFYASSGSTRLLLPASVARWERVANVSDDSLAVLRIAA